MKAHANWPLVENRIRRGLISHTFGMVRRNPDGTKRAHQGWDFYAPVGTDVLAVMSGTVAFSGERGDFGKLMVIAHSETLFTAYAHLSSLLLTKDDAVLLGQTIGKTGNTGNAAALKGEDQHVHFEVRTAFMPGLGLQGRISPLALFGICPLHETIKRRL